MGRRDRDRRVFITVSLRSDGYNRHDEVRPTTFDGSSPTRGYPAPLFSLVRRGRLLQFVCRASTLPLEITKDIFLQVVYFQFPQPPSTNTPLSLHRRGRRKVGREHVRNEPQGPLGVQAVLVTLQSPPSESSSPLLLVVSSTLPVLGPSPTDLVLHFTRLYLARGSHEGSGEGGGTLWDDA